MAWTYQAGKARARYPSNVYRNHAVRWQGTAASMVDLHPSGSFYTASWARASAFGQQVGTASYSYFEVEYRNAMKWNGTAASMTSLNPSIALSSEAFDTNHTQQVGYFVQPYGNPHEIVWNGSSTSYTDLHLVLPAGGNNTHSYATAISNSTGVISGYAQDIYGTQHAVLWYPV